MHDGGWWTLIRYDEKQDRPAVSWALIKRCVRICAPLYRQIAGILALILFTTLLGLVPPLLARDLIVRRCRSATSTGWGCWRSACWPCRW